MNILSSLGKTAQHRCRRSRTPSTGPAGPGLGPGRVGAGVVHSPAFAPVAIEVFAALDLPAKTPAPPAS